MEGQATQASCPSTPCLRNSLLKETGLRQPALKAGTGLLRGVNSRGRTAPRGKGVPRSRVVGSTPHPPPGTWGQGLQLPEPPSHTTHARAPLRGSRAHPRVPSPESRVLPLQGPGHRLEGRGLDPSLPKACSPHPALPYLGPAESAPPC